MHVLQAAQQHERLSAIGRVVMSPRGTVAVATDMEAARSLALLANFGATFAIERFGAPLAEAQRKPPGEEV